MRTEVVSANGYTYRKRRPQEYLEILCDHCRKPFDVKLRRLDERRFCSRSCNLAYRRAHRNEFGREMSPDMFWPRVDVKGPDDCWLWTGRRRLSGYGTFTERGKTLVAHRRAYQIAKGQIPHGLVVRHTCDNPPCVNPNHLLVGTTRDNQRDKVERGRSLVGGKNARARLTESVVAAIRANYRKGQSGHGAPALAARLGVSKGTIARALTGGSWRHAAGPVHAATPKQKTVSPKQKADAIALRAKGASLGSIAAAVGISKSYVSTLCRKARARSPRCVTPRASD